MDFTNDELKLLDSKLNRRCFVYNMSKPEIAEEIRLWVNENDMSDYYYDELRALWLETADYDCEGEFSEWLACICTPQQKIQAAQSI